MSRLEATLRRYPRQPLVVTLDAGLEAATALMERRAELSNVYVEMRPQRRYVDGPAVAHILGYVGEITAEELGGLAFLPEDYEQGMIVGKTGVEREYDEILQGEPGVRFVEVDARGRIVGDFAGSTSRASVPGGDLRLAVDLELQQWIHRIFPDDKMGAVVAIDPADGSVLALYSAPTFDPNEFVGGIDPGLWQTLNTDPLKPLYNRAVLGLYAPASMWKLATAAIGLELGVIDADDHMPTPCSGGITFGNRYWRCWEPEGHGSLDLAGAIQHSCDVWFYQLGMKIGLERLLREATDLGFSRPCGIDLPGREGGRLPGRPGVLGRPLRLHAQRERSSLSLHWARSQLTDSAQDGPVLYGACPRRLGAGAQPVPRARGPTEGWSLNVDAEGLAALRQGLRQVTGLGGTAYMSSLEHWDWSARPVLVRIPSPSRVWPRTTRGSRPSRAPRAATPRSW